MIVGEFEYSDAIEMVRLASLSAPVGVIVEIGTAKGLTAQALALHTGRHVISIDPDPDMDLTAMPMDITLVRMSSQAASAVLQTPPIALLLVDGCHCEECVLIDLVEWAPRVACGGYLVCHDIRQEGRKLYRPHGGEMHRDRRYGVNKALEAWGGKGFDRLEWGGNMAVFKRL